MRYLGTKVAAPDRDINLYKRSAARKARSKRAGEAKIKSQRMQSDIAKLFGLKVKKTKFPHYLRLKNGKNYLLAY